MTRQEGWQILCDYVQQESLRKHNLAVEACMRYYARPNWASRWMSTSAGWCRLFRIMRKSLVWRRPAVVQGLALHR